ncbi:PRA1 family protein-domain-containing protein [Amylocarpus encephaloides]|uniref:PRA1 family protein-domain-containing protein n=1 Tax=Amylocarpus encephaloides TaxID=45428 RepID=A0A9P8C992_9HELO|nr:PRA1 family protein-domain-containing protein [Amylocarpus encephaloides]
MARMQIPLDLLTSRLNLSDRFAGVRSQSIAARFANLKPISEFFDLKRLSKPANFTEVQSRVNYNLGHFSSNYAVVFVMLSIYSLLTNWLLLFVIILVVGGMWGIGKLEGRDLDVGFFRATSSQLYTGLLVVAVPLGIFASPISTILWLIGASFFWGGGLGGRPRSPKSMPSWGRPPGAKGSKRRKQWERERAMWEENVRVEELESDDTDTQGVGLHSGEKRFASDPLQFTGIDLAQQSMARRSYAFDDGGSASSGSSGSEGDESSPMQIALRDKEEALVQSALTRIRRAQEKGKLEVKLNQEELDALEKRRKRMQAAATQKKKGGGSGSGSERKRRSERNLISVPIAALDSGSQPSSRPSSRKTNSKPKRSGSNPPPSGTPSMLVSGPDGPMYAPISYFPIQGGSNRSSPARARSSSTAQPLTQAPPPFYPSPLTNRHFSDGMRPTSSSSTSSRRPLPDEEGWVPGSSRRSSVSSQSFGVDPFEYQTSSAIPPRISEQYLQSGRRNMSNPSDIAYASVRRSPPVGSGYPAAARGPPSGPALRHRSSYRDEIANESSEDESDDLGNGVQVYVEEERERERERPVSRKPVGSSRRKKGKR